MELNSVVDVGISDLQYATRAEIDRILREAKGDEITQSKLLIARCWPSVSATAITSSDSGPAPSRCARSRAGQDAAGAYDLIFGALTYASEALSPRGTVRFWS